MKQMTTCLDRAFEKKTPLKRKWKAAIAENNHLYVTHYHHLILVYNLNTNEVVFEWWEKQADKRGLDAAKKYLKERGEKMIENKLRPLALQVLSNTTIVEEFTLTREPTEEKLDKGSPIEEEIIGYHFTVKNDKEEIYTIGFDKLEVEDEYAVWYCEGEDNDHWTFVEDIKVS